MSELTQGQLFETRRHRRNLFFRWLLRRDMDRVLQIEHQVFPHPWAPLDFARCLKHRRHRGLAAEHDGELIAYCVIDLGPQRLEIMNLAVDILHQRRGVGRQFIDRVARSAGRFPIRAHVQEANLDAQLFFRACGFRCDKIIPDHYDNGATAYRFVRRRPRRR